MWANTRANGRPAIRGYLSRSFIALVVVLAGLVFARTAAAMPPTLASVNQQDRHPSASFSAPRASDATIYLATKPDRATDGSFLQENIKELDILTDSEIQSGQWLDENQVDPGTYWVMLKAYPDFDSCYVFDTGGFDPSCADGFSNVLTLVVPKPAIRYGARVRVYRYLGEASLELTASPLGERLAYRVCYRLKSGRSRCLNGGLDGYSWNASADDSLTVSTRKLATVTTFNWYVAGTKVASRRVRVR
jgi:hypothetical protein